ncbi:hypothetical protein BIV57_05140 [Mangrovactinospora gilvigrisea]|uniref:M23ase beta-sheet core domain-containing protein n=1 Tax=Mangrovactinospora gilvigrisea TaxID=1428644 RepID=A0A1J7CAM0_9ACTN|nr:peptidoglycan DD-metalloendopeptidase family protein [Mangrovactinospora gilvigrisea]OIV38560.1 hypothetical protein BIV57_05140 [Mangrovactinospora gilvigrisea]
MDILAMWAASVLAGATVLGPVVVPALGPAVFPAVFPALGPAVVPAVGRWPLAPPVVRGFRPPAVRWGPGHRGVDLRGAAGDAVRAAAAGRVAFAGRVAGRGVVTVELPGTGRPPLRTTYEPVAAQLRVGEQVRAGQVLGLLSGPLGHCPAGPCLHWGLRRGDAYLDPLLLLGPVHARLTPVPTASRTGRGEPRE